MRSAISLHALQSVMDTSRTNGSTSFGSASDLGEEDISRRQIHQLKEKEGNNVCADCGATGITDINTIDSDIPHAQGLTSKTSG